MLVLEEAKQLDLGREGEGVHFVREERTSVRLPNDAALGAVRAGESPGGVPEQLVLEEVDRDGAAVQRDKGTTGPRARIMDCPRAEFPAGSGLARDQDAGVAEGDPEDLSSLFQKRRRFPDELAEVWAAVGRLGGGPRRPAPRRQKSSQARLHVRRPERRQPIIAGASIHQRADDVGILRARHDHDRGCGLTRQQAVKQILPSRERRRLTGTRTYRMDPSHRFLPGQPGVRKGPGSPAVPGVIRGFARRGHCPGRCRR